MRSVRLGRLPLTVQVSAITLGVAATQGVNALLMAKWLGASDRGVVAIGQTLAMVMLLVGCGGLTTGARVILARPEIGVDLGQFLNSTRWLNLTQFMLLVVVGFTAFAHLARESSGVIVALFVALGVTSMRAAIKREALHGVGHHRTAMVSDIAGALSALLLLVAMKMLGHLSLEVAFGTLLAGALIQNLFQSIATRTPPRIIPRMGESSFRLLLKMLSFSLPGLVASLALVFTGRMDRLFLAYARDPSAVGVYATASTVADIAWIIPLASSAIITRHIATTGSTSSYPRWRLRIVGMTIALGALIYGASLVVFHWILGPEFAQGPLLVAILLVGAVGLALQQVDVAVCAGRGDLKAGAHVALWGAGVGLVLFWVLIPPFGAIGCSVASTLVYFTMAAVARLRVKRHLTEAHHA